MPITQARMIATVNAGKDYAQALEKLIRMIGTEYRGVRAGTSDAQSSLSRIMDIAQEYVLLTAPKESPAILQSEYIYFRRNASKNLAQARWQEKKRRAKGIQPMVKENFSVESPDTPFLETKHRIANQQDDFSFEQATGIDVEEEIRRGEQWAKEHPRPGAVSPVEPQVDIEQEEDET